MSLNGWEGILNSFNTCCSMDDEHDEEFKDEVNTLKDILERQCRNKHVTVSVTALFALLDMFYVMYCVKPEKIDQILSEFYSEGEIPAVINIPTDEDRRIVADCFRHNLRVLVDVVKFGSIEEGT
jgi:hypothetical protein